MEFYGKRRFEREDYGVTQPCQIQYIKYFQQYVIHQNQFPQVLAIKRVTFRGTFDPQDFYLKIIDKNDHVVYNTKTFDSSLRV